MQSEPIPRAGYHFVRMKPVTGVLSFFIVHANFNLALILFETFYQYAVTFGTVPALLTTFSGAVFAPHLVPYFVEIKKNAFCWPVSPNNLDSYYQGKCLSSRAVTSYHVKSPLVSTVDLVVPDRDLERALRLSTILLTSGTSWVGSPCHASSSLIWSSFFM